MAATVAYAAHCQQEKALDRPIAGHTNICPDSIVDGEKEILMLTSTMKHELLHALGFSLRCIIFLYSDFYKIFIYYYSISIFIPIFDIN